jgi:hypothetical protein
LSDEASAFHSVMAGLVQKSPPLPENQMILELALG